MHMSGTGVGDLVHGQGPGPGPAAGSCNPRKFSEKIALHTQRQAEDTAAFREVMVDITSIRVEAERVRQTRIVAPNYGGSLPNVNQIARCATETQYSSYFAHQPLHTDEGYEGYRDVQLNHLGRPHRRHFDSAPYLSAHLSPPRGPAWRRSNRSWSNCSATEKSQMVHLPLTALNRTNSDSALHTSVRNTHLHSHTKSAQILNPQVKHSGMFPRPAPLIEENIQEEARSPKLKKLSAMDSSGCAVPVVQNFPLPDQQVSSLPVSSALSTSGSLPDLSSLHLPSPLPVGQDAEPHRFTTSLSSADHLKMSPHADMMTDLSGLSSSLQTSLSNPLLQSSLSNPNIQSCLSSHSLPSSLSSTSLRLSLSNSSLQSSLSNQSLQSSLSSSSLSNQSSKSSASRCSGIGSSASSSVSGSPRVTGHTLASGSRKRAQLSPLMVPGGGDSRWPLPKQFSPTVSPTMSSTSQGVLFMSSKVKEPKPPSYPCPQQLKSTPVRHYFPPEAVYHSIPEMEQWSQYPFPSQSTFSSQHSAHKHSRQLQLHALNAQAKHHHSQLPAFPVHQQHDFPGAQQNQACKQADQGQIQPMFEEQYQCLDKWQLPCQQGQYQCPQPTSFAPRCQETRWNHVPSPRDMHAKPPFGHCMQIHEEPKPKITDQETEGHLHHKEGQAGSGPDPHDKCLDLKDSYVGLHLTPSQAKALSQQLGELQREPLGGSRAPDPHCQTAGSKEQELRSLSSLPSQTCGDEEPDNVFSVNLSDSSSWLDHDLSTPLESVLDFDLESFVLDSDGLQSLEDLNYTQ